MSQQIEIVIPPEAPYMFSSGPGNNDQLLSELEIMTIFQMIVWFICIEVLNISCKYFGQSAIDTNNQYSLNHLKYNTLYMGMLLEIFVLIILGVLLRKNFGIKHEQIDRQFYRVNYAFTTLRTIYLLVALISTLTQLFQVFNFTWNIDAINTWQNPKTEQFITNCSWLNAIVCWIFYLLNMVGIYLSIACCIPVPFYFLYQIHRLGFKTYMKALKTVVIKVLRQYAALTLMYITYSKSQNGLI